MTTLARSVLKPVLSLASGFGKHRKLCVFIYHRVLQRPDFMTPGVPTTEDFSWQMELAARYFNVLPLSEALTRLQEGSLPPRAVSITFDDGYADNHVNALPVLLRFGLPATFFIASGYLNGGRMWNDSIIESVRLFPQEKLDLTDKKLDVYDLSSPELRAHAASRILQQIKHLPPVLRQQYTDEIAKKTATDLPNDLMMTSEQLQKHHAAGMEIGGHTVSHPILANLDAEQVRQELKENKKVLNDLLGVEPRFFAYPNGKTGKDYLPEQVSLIKEAGYQAAVTTEWGVCNQTSDVWQLPRFTPWDNTPLKFMLRMARIYQQPM